MWRKLSLFTLVLFFSSCGRDLPALEGIDLPKWKEDKNGCGGYRESVDDVLQQELSQLKGLSEMDIISLLGKPDQNELYKRNQKFFYYFISPGSSCKGSSATPLKLILRFNAMGYAQLVSMEKD